MEQWEEKNLQRKQCNIVVSPKNKYCNTRGFSGLLYLLYSSSRGVSYLPSLKLKLVHVPVPLPSCFYPWGGGVRKQLKNSLFNKKKLYCRLWVLCWRCALVVYIWVLLGYYRGICVYFPAVHWIFYEKKNIVLTSGTSILIWGKSAPRMPTFCVLPKLQESSLSLNMVSNWRSESRGPSNYVCVCVCCSFVKATLLISISRSGDID